ncbi:EamA family transporter [Gramella sp. AN32]|uniref:EamA family transporter n=1 Tax=Christiangramia antarctica TaxID=2058158 RepID=A0ABW5X2K4_9FLAO|nr:EamA family transporter [Gramella sp. AN32]MCM4156836.1 EamA family transporter [Gramella sp. AN32]
MEKSDRLLIILAFFSIYVIWGSTYLLNKISVSQLSPLMLAGIRFTTAGGLIFLLSLGLGKSLRITKKQFLNSVFAGVLFLVIGNGGVVWALRFVDSNFAALEISSQPLVILLLMWLLQGKKIKKESVIGIILGIAGIYLLVSQKQVIGDNQSIWGMLTIFLCMMSWGYASIFVGNADLPKNYLVNTGYQMLSGGILLLIASMLLGEEWLALTSWEPQVQISMILLVLFGSIVAFTSFNFLLKRVSPEKVATSTYVNPIIAMFLGWYFLDELITVQGILAAVILLTGVYFINRTKTKVIAKKV